MSQFSAQMNERSSSKRISGTLHAFALHAILTEGLLQLGLVHNMTMAPQASRAL